jgi:hypothetical protein
MMNMEHDEIYSSMLVNRSIVYEYFRLIKYKDIHVLLSLFTHDAIVHEPFSNIAEGLQGKAVIRPFLEIAMMASNGLTHDIIIEKPYTNNNNNNNCANASKGHYNDNSNNKITALVTFQRGDSMRARFRFELVPVLAESNANVIPLKKKIKRLNIELIR